MDMKNDKESKYTIVTTGLKALSHKKMFADYDRYLELQLKLQKEEKEERELNEALMPSIFDYIITLGIITISAYGIYYLRR
jgi:predicted nuclease with TOPRIM domain